VINTIWSCIAMRPPLHPQMFPLAVVAAITTPAAAAVIS